MPADAAPHRAVDQGPPQLAPRQEGDVAGLDMLQRQRPHYHGDGLVAGVAADPRDDGHQGRQRHQLEMVCSNRPITRDATNAVQG